MESKLHLRNCMLIKIGSTPEPTDVVDLFLECHDRIRTFIALAGTLGQSEDSSEAEISDAAGRITRYFTEALPLHVADEEESIVPRLSGRDPDVDAALERMRLEHKEHEPQLESLLETCRSLQVSPNRLNELRTLLLAAASTLERQFLEHLQEEETIILPAIRTFLSSDDREAMLREVRARRTV
jgi:iron-sulfur cluster repair protein YtfE (RIC family)